MLLSAAQGDIDVLSGFFAGENFSLDGLLCKSARAAATEGITDDLAGVAVRVHDEFGNPIGNTADLQILLSIDNLELGFF